MQSKRLKQRCLQEDLDIDSQYKTDGETEE